MQQKTTEKTQVQNMVQAVPEQNVEVTNNLRTIIPEDFEFNLSDFALFMSVMKVKEAYEDVLSIILDEWDLKLKEVKAEQVVLNKSGKRAIRLDAWALDVRDRQFDMEMQNDTQGDDVRKRSRFYQGLIDTPILKSGKETRYKHLPSTTIIFITQDDIFEKDLAMYTFTERCEEVPELSLEDGTSKIFLNMTSKNGRPELISLLQYMKHTTLDNEDVIVKDKRILDLDRIVGEVRQSEEWEAVEMNIFEIGVAHGEELGEKRGEERGEERGEKRGIEKGIKQGIEKGTAQTLVKSIDTVMKNLGIDLRHACEALDRSVEEYENAKHTLALLEEDAPTTSDDADDEI